MLHFQAIAQEQLESCSNNISTQGMLPANLLYETPCIALSRSLHFRASTNLSSTQHPDKAENFGEVRLMGRDDHAAIGPLACHEKRLQQRQSIGAKISQMSLSHCPGLGRILLRELKARGCLICLEK